MWVGVFSILAPSRHGPSLDTVVRWSWQDSCAGNDDTFALRIRWGGAGMCRVGSDWLDVDGLKSHRGKKWVWLEGLSLWDKNMKFACKNIEKWWNMYCATSTWFTLTFACNPCWDHLRTSKDLYLKIYCDNPRFAHHNHQSSAVDSWARTHPPGSTANFAMFVRLHEGQACEKEGEQLDSDSVGLFLCSENICMIMIYCFCLQRFDGTWRTAHRMPAVFLSQVSQLVRSKWSSSIFHEPVGDGRQRDIFPIPSLDAGGLKRQHVCRAVSRRLNRRAHVAERVNRAIRSLNSLYFGKGSFEDNTATSLADMPLNQRLTVEGIIDAVKYLWGLPPMHVTQDPKRRSGWPPQPIMSPRLA